VSITDEEAFLLCGRGVRGGESPNQLLPVCWAGEGPEKKKEFRFKVTEKGLVAGSCGGGPIRSGAKAHFGAGEEEKSSKSPEGRPAPREFQLGGGTSTEKLTGGKTLCSYSGYRKRKVKGKSQQFEYSPKGGKS